MPKGNQLTEKDIALDLMTSSKAGITTLTKVLTETTNSQLRNTRMNELTTCVNSHHRLSDIAISKGWYNAHATPDEQLQKDLSSINEISQ